MDLFAGCGGLSLGFHRAGFRCISAIEKDENARKSHELNFSPLASKGEYAVYDDITSVSPEKAIFHLNPLSPDLESSVDVIIGGPPCQAFSRLGRAALWDLAGKKYAHGEDERATMYHYFLSYVDQLKPLAFVMENVREMGKFVGRNIAEEISVTADSLGYEVRYSLLNAVWFGVPQMRERLFLIGIRKEFSTIPSFPSITHEFDLPGGYSTARAGRGHQQVLDPMDHYVDHHRKKRIILPAVTAEEAFADLPSITEHLKRIQKKGPGNVDKVDCYAAPDDSNRFVYQMRNWPDFEASEHYFTGHIIRNTPRDWELFRRMPHGAMYPEALEIAHQIFEERLEKLSREKGREIKESSREWKELYKNTVPPYKVHRYPNKFRKMWPDQPARTVPAHIGKDSYSHIHFDSDQARGISLREAARLQSFPDGFKFSGSMNSQLAQIGNAVPPLMAYAVALSLKRDLDIRACDIKDLTPSQDIELKEDLQCRL